MIDKTINNSKDNDFQLKCWFSDMPPVVTLKSKQFILLQLKKILSRPKNKLYSFCQLKLSPKNITHNHRGSAGSSDGTGELWFKGDFVVAGYFRTSDK